MKVKYISDKIPVRLRSPDEPEAVASLKAAGYDIKEGVVNVVVEASFLPDPAKFMEHYGYSYGEILNISELVFVKGSEITSKLGGDKDMFHDDCPYAFVIGTDVELLV
ncbi:hypothetical protein [Escherichia coli]|uniref:hypothetical protein n=1 Tax=Escherichia coli TaxID=562 RepID=UPI000CFA817E|nr:hypothetical protein [Escherichia coli]